MVAREDRADGRRGDRADQPLALLEGVAVEVRDGVGGWLAVRGGDRAGLEVVRGDPADESARGDERGDAAVDPHGEAHEALLADEGEDMADRLVRLDGDDATRREREEAHGLTQFLVDRLEPGDGRERGDGDVLGGAEAVVDERVAQFARLEQEVEVAREVAPDRGDLPDERREAAAATLARLVEDALHLAVDAVVGALEAVDAVAVGERVGAAGGIGCAAGGIRRTVGGIRAVVSWGAVVGHGGRGGWVSRSPVEREGRVGVVGGGVVFRRAILRWRLRCCGPCCCGPCFCGPRFCGPCFCGPCFRGH